MDQHQKKKAQFSGAYLVLAFAALLFVQGVIAKRAAPKAVPMSELLQQVRDGKVGEVLIRDAEIVAVLRAEGDQPPPRIVATRLPGIDETTLVKDLQEKGVKFTGFIERASWVETFVVAWLLPIAVLGAIWFFLMRRLQGGRGGPLSIGKNKATIYDATQHGKVTFEDVAGVDEAEAELVEVVDFLKTPQKYTALGARIPKGVLLVGPPGTGKTLLARAVAGEAGVPFFSLSGSEFVEMFVGLGAARMRDLFEQAKTRAPCIVFIDELDAIGRSRGGVAAMSTHDEREQTLNQLLVEMDGFQGTAGVMIMAATNRPEVLDQALLRSGRFDRQVVVDRPDLRGREEILKVHVRGVKLADDASLRVLAQRTPGMVGADLAKIVNEAALAAARRGSTLVAQKDFEEAIDRIQLGLEKKGQLLGEDEKRRVAYHESGHALVALRVDHANPVHRVTIIPRSIGALGVTLQLPTGDRYLVTRAELLDRICVFFGGRVAEELVCGDISTGAHDDLTRGTETARQMVTRLGMSEKLGPMTFGRTQSFRFLEGMGMEERNYSEETARAIDAEVRAILDGQHRRATEILTREREVLERMARRLIEVETLDRAEIDALVTGPAVAAAKA
ncbi:MAG TPA: ATP-dependent zinc metalloprotease FtsH [Vicinamibacteria bacterium]|nr:ATP-dependent zinc metalloprotease FtsH [Vicinamibacteria bacterium]